MITTGLGGRLRPVIVSYVAGTKGQRLLPGAVSYGEMRLPTDPIGTFNLTLTNVAVGSRIHVEKQSDGTSFYDNLATSSTVVISLSAYAAGSAYNDLRIKVRKGSTAPKYLPFETFATALVGSVSVYVAQVPDTIAS